MVVGSMPAPPGRTGTAGSDRGLASTGDVPDNENVF